MKGQIFLLFRGRGVYYAFEGIQIFGFCGGRRLFGTLEKLAQFVTIFLGRILTILFQEIFEENLVGFLKNMQKWEDFRGKVV